MLNIMFKYQDGWGQIAIVKPESADHFIGQAKSAGKRVVAVDDNGKVISASDPDDLAKQLG